MKQIVQAVSYVALGAGLQGLWAWWVDRRRIKRGREAVERWQTEFQKGIITPIEARRRVKEY